MSSPTCLLLCAKALNRERMEAFLQDSWTHSANLCLCHDSMCKSQRERIWQSRLKCFLACRDPCSFFLFQFFFFLRSKMKKSLTSRCYVGIQSCVSVDKNTQQLWQKPVPIFCHESSSSALAQGQSFPHYTMFMCDSNSVGLNMGFTAFCSSSRAVSEV